MKTFAVTAKVVCEVDIEIRAHSMEEALAEARELKAPDFVTPTNSDESFNDFEDLNIRMVWERS